jgi:WD40 repeat protein
MLTINRIHALTMVAVATSLYTPNGCRGADDTHKERVRANQVAVAQFMDGRFQVIYLSGRTLEFEKPAYYFTSARFSSDGEAIVGTLGPELVVLNQSLETLWRFRPPHPNVWNMALSPSKTQVAFISLVGGNRFSLGLAASSGEERTLTTFERQSDDESWGLSWSPDGHSIVLASERHIKIVDVATIASETVGDGFEPTWSPNGKWIAYRSVEGRAELWDVATRQRSRLGPGPRIISKVHWAPGSDYVMVEEDYGVGPSNRKSRCPVKRRFVVYGLVDGSRREIFNPCLMRDWSFDWISDPEKWVSGMKPSR